jgi:ATP-dependent RNA helicase DeaD
VRRELERRGLGDGVRYAAFGEDNEASDRIISYDVPSSAQELKAAHETGGTVLVTPAELTHFKRIAAEVPFTTKQRRARVLDESALDSYRDTIRAAMETEDISAQMLVLDPLFDTYSPVEVAAALSALLRRRAPAAAQASAQSVSSAGAVPREATSGGTTKLFLSIGTRDNVRPGDLVGAITGEANIKGEQVGLVDIRESFSVVEVNSDVADKVIRALNGTTMKGRSLRVDFDRKNAAGGGEARRSSGPPRAPRGDGPPRKPGPPRGSPRDDAGGRGPSGPRRRPTER